MAESSVSSGTHEGSKSINVLDLEADGVVSVYANGRFVWQLPKKLLYGRVPAAKPKGATDEEDSNDRAIWEISGCGEGAVRLFNEWLYNTSGQIKEPAPDKPAKDYLELNHLASKYEIHELTAALAKIVEGLPCESDESLVETYDAMPAKSIERANISARYAALIVTKQVDVDGLKPLIKSSELARDILVWVAIYYNHIQGGSQDEITESMAAKSQLWADAQEADI